MANLILVFLGGGLGASLRYFCTLFISSKMLIPGITPTLFINILGSLVAGFVISGLIGSPKSSLFFVTGILGGFTTFSMFSVETVDLLRAGNMSHAALYVGLSVIGSILACWAGFYIRTITT